MISVLFTIPNFITAGSGGAMLNIVERLDPRRFSPAVCVATKGGNLDTRVTELGIPFLEHNTTVPIRPYTTLLFRAWRAAQPFRKYRSRVWHSFHYSADYSEPIIARFAGAKAWVFTKKNMGWRERAWRVRSALATRIAAQNTDMLREFFSNRRLARKACLVPRGVVVSRFSPDMAPALRIRESLGIGPGAVVVSCVAQLLPIKGHPTLIEALQNVPDAHLLLAGTPLDEHYVFGLKERIAQMGLSKRIHFLGAVKEVAALLSETDIFVLPTWAKGEGCPVALLEAMSCGKPCVATNVPGSRDLVEDGISGRLVPPEDAATLARVLDDLVAEPDLRIRLGAGARNRVLERYTIDHEVEAHQALYTGLGFSD